MAEVACLCNRCSTTATKVEDVKNSQNPLT